jgi:Divergent InlB B-repeat domain/Galactose oxidase, central domain/Kelch motif
MPGSRYGSVSWVDSDGSLWLFGGYGYSGTVGTYGTLNDLWKFDVHSWNWTWVKGSDQNNDYGDCGTQGVEDEANSPGSRQGGYTWVDNDGTLWLFGGRVSFSTYYNDLWKFNPTTENWTWVEGAIKNSPVVSDNFPDIDRPGPRSGGQSWVGQDGNLWLMGGKGYTFDVNQDMWLNDLWRYNLESGDWDCLKIGDLNQTAMIYNGTYGTQGVTDQDNVPGGRSIDASWVTDDGSFWMFGGYGYGSEQTYSSSNDNYHNDLWKLTSSYTVEFQVDETVGASITGNITQSGIGNTGWTSVTAAPPTDYHFIKWLKDGEVFSRDNPLLVSDVSEDMTLVAQFADQLTLTYVVDSTYGSLTGDAIQLVDYGADGSTVTAVGNEAYHFVSWSDGVLTASRQDLSITDYLTVTASFEMNTYTLTYTCGPHGSLSLPWNTTQTVTHGEDAEWILAQADSGYSFDSWSDGYSAYNRIDRNVTGNINAVATFVDRTAPSYEVSWNSEFEFIGNTIDFNYTVSDLGSGVNTVQMWGRSPGESAFSALETAHAPNKSSFSYPVSSDGVYQFAMKAVDHDGNETVVSADFCDSFSVNIAADNNFTYISRLDGYGGYSGDDYFKCLLTDDCEVSVEITNPTEGGVMTLSRQTGDVAPPGLDPANLIDECLTIEGSGFNDGWSLYVYWNCPNSSVESIPGEIDTIYRVVNNAVVETYPYHLTCLARVPIYGLTEFGTFYAGTSSTNVGDWNLY